jgi:single-stranded DNA-binding protein
LTNFVVATNEFRGNGAPERTDYHNLVAWDRLAEICGQFLCGVQPRNDGSALS